MVDALGPAPLLSSQVSFFPLTIFIFSFQRWCGTSGATDWKISSMIGNCISRPRRLRRDGRFSSFIGGGDESPSCHFHFPPTGCDFHKRACAYKAEGLPIKSTRFDLCLKRFGRTHGGRLVRV
ncbi:hypothetical protein P152DRAFT_333444 [Eremomyces bilateralis CBS 781.70]|uniref:Uncharacterized protein n=1 Tax=Eremomyces bilateralis CBS 781.70 TaxID=1392243 RepID=A0A6G1G4Q6_9PEZI|nr:uncharacterized protein P152DRAFT_333444 [Eremomyces bilateralis CBS 781.70]KAF1812982.1 hypothetical protein P152DRAFT_333444 [Eremomyces bilateralis CBS 781.70]